MSDTAEGLHDIARAILMLSGSMDDVAKALRDLGNGNALTDMGAIEAFGKHLGERMDYATETLAEAITSTREE